MLAVNISRQKNEQQLENQVSVIGQRVQTNSNAETGDQLSLKAVLVEHKMFLHFIYDK